MSSKSTSTKNIQTVKKIYTYRNPLKTNDIKDFQGFYSKKNNTEIMVV